MAFQAPSVRQQPFFADPRAQFMICFLAGLALRGAAFGDPNIYVDESYYLLVGHEMRAAAIPYVDIWDRKPLGIFLLYWVFAGFRDSILAYQLGAWISASWTAFVVTRISGRWLCSSHSLAAGILYLAVIGSILGIGGQTPVFYTAATATGALLLIRYTGEGAKVWELYLAMLLFGIAITFKQTAVFGAAFFGLYAVSHHRSVIRAVLQIAIGASPFMAIALFYYSSGHWFEFYDAMVTANTHRPMLSKSVLAFNLLQTGIKLFPLMGVAAYGLLFCDSNLPKRFIGLWIGAELVGFLSVPFIIEHYAIPLAVPLSIAAASALSKRPAGPALVAVAGAVAIIISSPWAFARHRMSTQGFQEMAKQVGRLPQGRHLFVYDGPPLLYHAVGSHPPSVLAFPGHLNNIYEKDVSRISTSKELRRVISSRPAAVVMTVHPAAPADKRGMELLVQYVESNCARKAVIDLISPFGERVPHYVYSMCR